MKRHQNNAAGFSRRLHFPDDEKRLPWLPLLLDAYAIADDVIDTAITNEINSSNKRLACGQGCVSCCEHHKDLPLFPHELVGIYWYVKEKMPASEKPGLKERLGGHKAEPPCPFLGGGSCSIHPLRPLGCRQFNVFGARCLPGEDPYYTRRDDVLTFSAGHIDRAFAAVIPLYRLNESGAAEAVRLIRAQILNLQTFNWKKLAANI